MNEAEKPKKWLTQNLLLACYYQVKLHGCILWSCQAKSVDKICI